MQRIAVGSGGLLSLPSPGESVGSRALCLILRQVLCLGFRELLAPQNLSQQHRCTPILQQKGKFIRCNLQFCGTTVLQRMGFLCTWVRDDAEKYKYLFYYYFIIFFPIFFLPCTSPKLSLVAASSPRQQHLSPGLFLPSLFGIAISSRTKSHPINNSSLRSCLLPTSLVSLCLPFSLPCLFFCLQRRDAIRAWSRGSSYSTPS